MLDLGGSFAVRPSVRVQEFQPDHRSPAAQVAGPVPGLLPTLDPGGHRLADADRPLHQPVALDHRQGGNDRSTGDGIAAEGAAVGTALPAVHQAMAGDDRADRQSIAQSLGQDHYVRHHLLMVDRQPASGAPHPGLNLVADQQDAVLIADASKGPQESVRRHHVPTLPLDRLDQDRRYLIGGQDLMEETLNLSSSRDRAGLTCGVITISEAIRVGRDLDAW